MATLNSLNLTFDITNANKDGLLLNFSTSQPGTIPSFFRNDGITVTMRPVAPSVTTSRPWDDQNISADTVTLAIGAFDKSPDNGTWYIYSGTNQTSGTLVVGKTYQIITFVAGDSFTNVGAGSNASSVIFIASGTTPTTWTNSSILQEITTSLAYNITPAALQTALNATNWMNTAGGCTVTSTDTGTYEVQFVSNGLQSTMTGYGGFTPACSVSIYAVVAGSSSIPALQIIEIDAIPYAQTQTWTSLPSAAATVTLIAAGSGSAPNVQQVTLSPTPYAGTFQLTTSLLTTAAISAPASATSVQAALNTGGNNYIVTGSSGGPYTITTVALGSVATITVNVTGLLVPVGLTGTMNLSTYGMLQAFLDAETSTLGLFLEVQVIPVAGYPVTVLQVPVTVSKNVINLGNLSAIPLPTYYTSTQVLALIATCVGNVATPSSETDYSTLPGGVKPTGNNVYFAPRDENGIWCISSTDTTWKVISKSAIS